MINAPSNAAVDTLLEKLVLALPSSYEKPTVVRLGRVGGDTHDKERADRMYLQAYELDAMVDKRIEAYRHDRSTRNNTESDGYLRKQFEQELLLRARVVRPCRLPHPQVVSTLVTAANTQVTSFLNQGSQVPVVIIDEATQCTEPQCLIPLCVKPALLVLVGDSHQLAATIQNPTVDRMGYGVSLFERWERNGFPKLSLRVQYRMSPEICRWPNDYVYGGLLIDSKRVRQSCFRSVFGESGIPAFCFVSVEVRAITGSHG